MSVFLVVAACDYTKNMNMIFNTLPLVTQPYQACMFQVRLTMGFFGLFCPGELTISQHVILWANIQCDQNLIFVRMESSKCNKTSTPQLLHIYQEPYAVCPLKAMQNYLSMHPTINEGPLFIHLDGQLVTRSQLSRILDKLSVFLNLPHQVIKPHLLWIGGTTDLYLQGVQMQEIQKGAGGLLIV